MSFLRDLFPKDCADRQDIFHQELVHYGSANKNKVIYLIKDCDRNIRNIGFFALYRRWLEYLYFADVCGYTPVISEDLQFSYRERKAVHNTTNPFEYYFVQPAGISVQEAKRSDKVILSESIHREMVELVMTGKRGSYGYNSRYLYALALIAAKYIKPNRYMKKYIDEGLAKIHFGEGKMLGIHMRGTDFRAMFHNHPVYVTEEECFVEIDKILGQNRYDKVFLATDDKRILRKFVNRYGDKLCFYEDVERGSENKSVAFHHSTRDMNKYLLGMEVIRDMYSLSMCTGLIAGVSQVSICAQIHKLARKEKYEDKRIIDKGVYCNQNIFTRRVWT